MGIHSSCQWTLLSLLASLLTHCAHITSYFRLKSLRDELDKLEDKLKLAERNVTSLEAQRKAAVADKGRLSKQVTYQHLTVWICVTYPVYAAVLCEIKHYSVGISVTSSRVPRGLTFIGSRARMCSDVCLCIFKKGISSTLECYCDWYMQQKTFGVLWGCCNCVQFNDRQQPIWTVYRWKSLRRSWRSFAALWKQWRSLWRPRHWARWTSRTASSLWRKSLPSERKCMRR